jgi:hypothetical protein
LENKNLSQLLILGAEAFDISSTVVPHTRLKAKLAKQSVTISRRKIGRIFTSIGAKRQLFLTLSKKGRLVIIEFRLRT